MLYLSKSRKRNLDNGISILRKSKLEKKEETEESSEEKETMAVLFFKYFKLLSNDF